MNDFIYKKIIIQTLKDTFPGYQKLTEQSISAELDKYCEAVNSINSIGKDLNKFTDQQIIYFSANVLLNYAADQADEDLYQQLISCICFIIKQNIESKFQIKH